MSWNKKVVLLVIIIIFRYHSSSILFQIRASTGIDFILLNVLLTMQYLCGSPSWKEMFESSSSEEEALENSRSSTISSSPFYSCNSPFSTGDQDIEIVSFSIGSFSFRLDFSVASLFILLYGIIMTIMVCIHAHFKFKKLGGVYPKIEKVYEWTDRVVIIDSILEIPITFVFAPIWTLVLWTIATGLAIGLFITCQKYAERDDATVTTFITNCIMIGLSLLKFTGDISQYIVLYKASVITVEEELGLSIIEEKLELKQHQTV